MRDLMRSQGHNDAITSFPGLKQFHSFHLGNGGPVGKLLDTLAQLRVGKNIPRTIVSLCAARERLAA